MIVAGMNVREIGTQLWLPRKDTKVEKILDAKYKKVGPRRWETKGAPKVDAPVVDDAEETKLVLQDTSLDTQDQ